MIQKPKGIELSEILENVIRDFSDTSFDFIEEFGEEKYIKALSSFMLRMSQATLTKKIAEFLILFKS